MRIDKSRITYECIDPATCKYEVTYTFTYEERFGWIDNLPSLEGKDISDWEYKTAELPETITRSVICPGGEPNMERFINAIDASIFSYQWIALGRIIEGHKTYIGCYKSAMTELNHD